MSHKFQVHLRGLIDLLSKHLYSGPRVYVRELLQNGTDAIQARLQLAPNYQGEITLEVIESRAGKPPTLVFTDNGIGLTEDEIHEFLATIGQSSKRGDDGFDRPVDFIGQFGVGLLSCFIVSDEIVVVTRSARQEDARAIEWRGRQDGTYLVKTLEASLPSGTQVYLTCKPGAEEWFEPERVRELAKHYGSLLPFPVRFIEGKDVRNVNDEAAPWRQRHKNPEQERRALLAYGRQVFESKFLDAIPLRAEAGKVEGVAFVLPFTPSLAHKQTHRVYLKNMLLSEQAEGLLPDWAFFVKCVVNAQDLRPMASREAFYEDDALAAAREELGRCIRAYLVRLSADDPERLRKLIGLHYLAFKALASQDDDFFRLIIDFLPFETSLGRMTLAEFRRDHEVLRFVPTHDQFRQISGVAAAQGMAVINGGYTYDMELLEKYGNLFPDTTVEAVEAATFAQSFEDLSLEEQEQAHALLKAADAVLRPFRCTSEIKKFLPKDLPTLYSTSRDGQFFRSVEQSKEVADSLWSSVLDNLVQKPPTGTYAQLCFNYQNPLVRRLARLHDKTLLRRGIEMLYVQALLLGHHPLQKNEMALLNEGLLGLIDHCLQHSERGANG